MVPIEYQQIAAAVALSIFRIQAMFDENPRPHSFRPVFRRHPQHTDIDCCQLSSGKRPPGAQCIPAIDPAWSP